MLMLGTKWPSMTSTWMRSAPARSASRTWAPSRAKSAARIDGASLAAWVMAALLGVLRLAYEPGERSGRSGGGAGSGEGERAPAGWEEEAFAKAPRREGREDLFPVI